jgi:hypothetical protein
MVVHFIFTIAAEKDSEQYRKAQHLFPGSLRSCDLDLRMTS